MAFLGKSMNLTRSHPYTPHLSPPATVFSKRRVIGLPRPLHHDVDQTVTLLRFTHPLTPPLPLHSVIPPSPQYLLPPKTS